MDNKILLLGGAAIAYYLYTQKRAISLLNYYIHGVALDFQGLAPILKIDIGIQNPSNTGFEVRDFVGNLVANGNNIGTMSAFTPLTVAPASQVIYPVYIRLNAIGIVEDIIQLIQSQSGISQTIALTGYVNASGIVAPINLTYKIAF